MMKYQLLLQGRALNEVEADNIDEAVDKLFPSVPVDVDLERASSTRIEIRLPENPVLVIRQVEEDEE